MIKKPSSKGKLSKKAAPASSHVSSPAIESVSQPDEDRIRERAHSIWVEEGRPHGRDLAHWERARHELLSEEQ
jgi:Protein of unknown function (DUF2934)